MTDKNQAQATDAASYSHYYDEPPLSVLDAQFDQLDPESLDGDFLPLAYDDERYAFLPPQGGTQPARPRRSGPTFAPLDFKPGEIPQPKQTAQHSVPLLAPPTFVPSFQATATNPPQARTLSPEQKAQRNAVLQEKLERYIALRDTIESLTSEKEELSTYIKTHIQAGDRAQASIDTPKGTVVMRPVLKVNKRRVIPFLAFAARFGEVLAQRAASIDIKAADALAKSGEIEPSALKSVTQYEDMKPALYIVPVEKGKV